MKWSECCFVQQDVLFEEEAFGKVRVDHMKIWEQHCPAESLEVGLWVFKEHAGD